VPVHRRWAIVYEYVECVRGERRAFVHETAVEAESPEAARQLAIDRFHETARLSGVGWTRLLKSCVVASA